MDTAYLPIEVNNNNDKPTKGTEVFVQTQRPNDITMYCRISIYLGNNTWDRKYFQHEDEFVVCYLKKLQTHLVNPIAYAKWNQLKQKFERFINMMERQNFEQAQALVQLNENLEGLVL